VVLALQMLTQRLVENDAGGELLLNLYELVLCDDVNDRDMYLSTSQAPKDACTEGAL